MMNILIVFLISISVLSAVSLDLPTYFTKCKKDDHEKLNDCILTNLFDNWSIFVKGDKTYHIQNMVPLSVPFMQVKVDRNLYGNMTNGIVTGYDQIEFKSVNMDLDKKSVDVLTFWPLSSMAGDYDISGRLLNLDISDKGTTNVTFVNGLIKYHFTYELKDRREKQYIQILESKIINEKVERIYFNTEFNRSKQLGDAINKVLNENWEEVTEQVQTSVGEALGGIFKAILQPFFNKVPFNNLFA